MSQLRKREGKKSNEWSEQTVKKYEGRRRQNDEISFALWEIHAQIIPTFFTIQCLFAYIAYFIHKTKTDIGAHNDVVQGSHIDRVQQWELSPISGAVDGQQSSLLCCVLVAAHSRSSNSGKQSQQKEQKKADLMSVVCYSFFWPFGIRIPLHRVSWE